MKSARSSECRPSTEMSSTRLARAAAAAAGVADGGVLQATAIGSSPMAAARSTRDTRQDDVMTVFSLRLELDAYRHRGRPRRAGPDVEAGRAGPEIALVVRDVRQVVDERGHLVARGHPVQSEIGPEVARQAQNRPLGRSRRNGAGPFAAVDETKADAGAFERSAVQILAAPEIRRVPGSVAS